MNDSNHVYNIAEIDGEKYNLDLILDLRNIQTKMELQHFGRHSQLDEWYDPKLVGCSNLEDSQMKRLYRKFGYATIESIKTGKKREVFYEDVIEQLVKEMEVITPERLYEIIYGEKPIGISQKELANKFLYYKAKFVFEFLQKRELEFAESKNLFKKIFSAILESNEIRRISYANLRQRNGTYAYMYSVEDKDGTKHYFEYKEEENEIKEVDITSDKSIVTVFDTRRRLFDIAKYKIDEQMTPLRF